jgi:hypothetical protein
MGFLRRLAFILGLLLGLTTVAAAGAVALTYLFTGKLASVEMREDKPEITLMTPDQVAALIRAQRKGKSEAELDEQPGGESDDSQE